MEANPAPDIRLRLGPTPSSFARHRRSTSQAKPKRGPRRNHTHDDRFRAVAPACLRADRTRPPPPPPVSGNATRIGPRRAPPSWRHSTLGVSNASDRCLEQFGTNTTLTTSPTPVTTTNRDQQHRASAFENPNHDGQWPGDPGAFVFRGATYGGLDKRVSGHGYCGADSSRTPPNNRARQTESVQQLRSWRRRHTSSQAAASRLLTDKLSRLSQEHLFFFLGICRRRHHAESETTRRRNLIHLDVNKDNEHSGGERWNHSLRRSESPDRGKRTKHLSTVATVRCLPSGTRHVHDQTATVSWGASVSGAKRPLHVQRTAGTPGRPPSPLPTSGRHQLHGRPTSGQYEWDATPQQRSVASASSTPGDITYGQGVRTSQRDRGGPRGGAVTRPRIGT